MSRRQSIRPPAFTAGHLEYLKSDAEMVLGALPPKSVIQNGLSKELTTRTTGLLLVRTLLSGKIIY